MKIEIFEKIVLDNLLVNCMSSIQSESLSQSKWLCSKALIVALSFDRLPQLDCFLREMEQLKKKVTDAPKIV